MKRTTFFILTLMALALLPSGVSARKALVVAHYGSSDDDTRAKTIGMITADIRDALPGIEVREAYISPVVRINMAKRGIDADSPEMAAMRLYTEGYDTVYLQSTTILDGGEMAEVRKAAETVRPFFKMLKTGLPLCYTPEDCARVVDILGNEPRAKDETIIFAGHGNLLPSTATYCLLDYMLAEKGKKFYHVSTIEGYPTPESTITQLDKEKAPKKVKLIPLLLVCGNHTRNDIAVDYAAALIKAGYKPETLFRGLAELPAIRALYVARAVELTKE